MFRFFILGAIALTAAAIGPAAFYSAKERWDLSGGGSSADAAAAASQQGEVPNPNAPTPGTAQPTASLPLEGLPTSRLDEVFRFDVSTGWVMKRWPRVSTGMADLHLQGYRVPLMTGTELSDLAGSLTYYFGAEQEVERITFTGTTGNARELVALVTRRYGFVRRMTNNPGMFIYEAAHSKKERKSLLELHLARVVNASRPYQRFDVKLSIERPEK